MSPDFSDLQGKTLVSVAQRTGHDENDEIVFTTTDGDVYTLYHSQDCCESVCIESIVGDPNDLVGTPILVAEERSNHEDGEPHESSTWTFYTLRTIKGSVDIRWFGSSNGYYSESVSLRVEEATREAR